MTNLSNHNVDLRGAEQSVPHKEYLISVKTGTLMYSKPIISYPLKGKAVNDLLKLDLIYTIDCGDNNLPATINNPREGNIVRVKAKELHQWLTVDGKSYYNNPNHIKQKGSVLWANVPLNDKWCRVVSRISESDRVRLRGMGNSDWKNQYYKTNKNFDRNAMTKKGQVGEEIIKQYLEKQDNIKEVIMNDDIYGFYDLKVIVEKGVR